MINRFREALTSNSAFSLIGWILLLPWSYLVTWTLRPNQEPTTLFLLVAPLVAHLIGGLFVFLGYKIQLATNWRYGLPITILAFAAYGFFRSATVNFTLKWLNPEYEISYSLISTATIVAVVWQTLTAIMIHYARLNLAIIAELENHKNELDSDIGLLQRQLEFLRGELPQQINFRVQDVLKQIERGTKSSHSAIQSAEKLLSTLLNDYVRPLSQELRASKPMSVESRERVTPISLAQTLVVFVKDITDVSPFAPLTVSAIVTATGLPVIMIFAGWEKFPFAASVISFGIWFLIGLAGRIYDLVKKQFFPLSRFLLLMVLWTLPGLIIGSILRLDADITEKFVYLPIAGPLLTLISSLVAAIYFAGISRRRMLIESLDKQTNEKNFKKQTLRQEVKIAENQLIHLLHGKLQGQLNVLRTQIETSDPNTEITVREIEQSLEQILQNQDSRQGFETTLNTLLKLWGRVATIKVEISDEIMRKLRRQRFVGFATIEVIREVLNNSIKHGEAKNITISIEQQSSQQLELEIRNDGSFRSNHDSPGLGTSLLNDYCINWHIQGDESGTVFEAAIICPESV